MEREVLAPLLPSSPSDTYLACLDRRRTQVLNELLPLFSSHSTFVWEVGCGHGHFLTAFAQAHPEKLCVGIDIVGERIDRALRKRDRARLPNLHFIRTEATLFLTTLPPPFRISQCFVLFPDPWPKQRHQKHRVMQSAFLTHAAARATPDSQLCFRTDFAPYFEQVLALTRVHPGWEVTNEPWPFEFETVFQQRATQFQSLTARRLERFRSP